MFVALLCVVLAVVLAAFMTVEIAHNHPAGDASSNHCQFCASAHVAIDAQPSWLTGYVLRLVGVVSAGEPSPGSCPVVVTAFIRPPPAVL
jgi:hypothetical protein